ncbi:MAG: glycine betaine ABC transporter substrate-binding protein [Acidimicrobiales bacterium]
MKRQHILASVMAMALVVTGAACGDDDDDDDAATSEGEEVTEREGPTVQIGTQDFGESAILAEIYSQALEADGFQAEIVEVGGFRDLLFESFDNGDVNLAPDYVASQLNFLEPGTATSDVEESLDALRPLLEEQGLAALEPSEAVDTNTFVMLTDTADETGIASLSDLAENGADLSLGAPPDCEENAFCLPGLQEVYGLDMSGNFTPLELDLIPTSLEEGAIDVGVFLSTSGRLTEEQFLVLEDDEGLLAADNVFPVASQELVDAYEGDLDALLDSVSAELDTDGLIELNARYDIDGDEPEDIAAEWLADHGLV